jgi:VanZ family protein
VRFFVLFLVVALIAYGSLYPFSFSHADPESWRTLFNSFRLFTSRGDVLGNILLFIPLGYTGMLALSPRTGMKAGACFVGGAGFMLAAGLQFAQLYLPLRDAVLSDVVWNVLGLAFGIAAAFLLPLAANLDRRQRSLPVVPLALLALWFAHELAPFLPTLDWQKFKEGLKPLLLNPQFKLANAVFHFACALAAGRALGEIVGERRSLRWLVACASLVTAGKIVIVSQAVTLSFAIGLLAACAVWVELARSPRRDAFVALALVLAITLMALDPFMPRWPPAQLNLIPFAGQLEGAMLVNLRALLEKLFLYTALLWLVTGIGKSLWASALALAVFVLLLEGAQTFVAGRVADATEAVWVLVTAAVLRAGSTRR